MTDQGFIENPIDSFAVVLSALWEALDAVLCGFCEMRHGLSFVKYYGTFWQALGSLVIQPANTMTIK